MRHWINGLLAWLITITVSGCGGGGDSSNAAPNPAPNPSPSPNPGGSRNLMFEVYMTNLTIGQPLSPPAIFLHREGYNAFLDGRPASRPIELIAEAGARSELLNEIKESVRLLATHSSGGVIRPAQKGPADQLSFSANAAGNPRTVRITAVTMLESTNDAFTGVNAVDVSDMVVGETRILDGFTWDAGTEANTETAATVPGPGIGGRGFSSERDDHINRVRFHQGVVTSLGESGIPNSVLIDEHRFDNPSSLLTIKRIE